MFRPRRPEPQRPERSRSAGLRPAAHVSGATATQSPNHTHAAARRHPTIRGIERPHPSSRSIHRREPSRLLQKKGLTVSAIGQGHRCLSGNVLHSSCRKFSGRLSALSRSSGKFLVQEDPPEWPEHGANCRPNVRPSCALGLPAAKAYLPMPPVSEGPSRHPSSSCLGFRGTRAPTSAPPLLQHAAGGVG